MTDVALDALDVASGMVIGSLARAGAWPGSGDAEPLAAVEAVVLRGLLRPPCLVSFSGGRDSSALLAVAVDVARREGLDRPVPITARFGVDEADEQSWQETMVTHLGVRDWLRVDITDELDLLGDIGATFLRRHGLRYPQNTHSTSQSGESVSCKHAGH